MSDRKRVILIENDVNKLSKLLWPVTAVLSLSIFEIDCVHALSLMLKWDISSILLYFLGL